MSTAEDLVGADLLVHRRVRRSRQRRLRGRSLALATLTCLLVALMTWPSGAQETPTSSTASPPTMAPTTTETTAAPTTAAPTTVAPTTSAPATTAAPSSSEVVTSQLEATTTTGVNAEEKAKLDAAAAAKAQEIDAANARLGDLSDALTTLSKRVRDQSAKVDAANSEVAAAEVKVQQNEAAVAEAEQSLVTLEQRLQGQAIRNFMGEGGEAAGVLATGDPNQSIRMQKMLADVTQSDIDFSDTLLTAKEDLEVQRAEAQDAVDAAEALRVDANDQLAILQGDRKAQSTLTASAEDRLDHLLSERANLGALGADIDTGDEAKLVNTLKSSGASTPPPDSSVAIPATVSESEIKLAGKGIRVHESIVAQVQQLLTDADAAGFDLAGGGYRDPAAQIATRKSNCGTSTYAIYQMPASQCSPPTARPGQSMHERGLAIDFTYKGQLIRSRSSAAWVWLSNNAAKYGLCNLPSEAWHWSVNCK